MAEKTANYSEWNVYKKLAKARVMLQNRKLKKSGVNKFAGFNYFELADFLPAVNEIFDELGLCAIFIIEDARQDVINSETGVVIETPAQATLTILNIDKDERIVFASAIAEAGTKGASPIQNLGSVHTYMRRYLYMEALEIVESDGLDSLNGTEKITAGQPKASVRQAKKVQGDGITAEQIERIQTLFAGDSDRMDAMMAVYNITALDQLTAKQADAIIKRMEGEKK